MKYNRVGIAAILSAALLIALPCATVLAQQESDDSITSSQNDERENDEQENDERKNEKNETTTERDGKSNEERRDNTTTTGKSMAEEHRSEVATFVLNLLQTADKNENDIGEQVRNVAREQDDSETTTTEAIKKIESRSAIKTFLVGTDYKNIGVLRSQIVKTQARIDQLARLFDRVGTSTVSASATEQLQLLKQTENKLLNFISSNENKFSLFGWLAKLFNR